MRKVFVIAEAGVNHNGSLEIAKKMIDVAVDSGSDAIKFQTFKAEKVISKFAPKAEYQKKTTQKSESQLEMVKKFELDEHAHKTLQNYCRKKGIIFLSSPFDIESVELLHKLGLEIFKIPSGEITNLPYLRKIGSLRKNVIMSSGMADLGEIEDALDILIESGTPREDITVLHCNTEYPTPFEDVNLLAMLAMREAFKVNVGYSDHTLGIEASIAAASIGATVVEKHFTLDKNMEGPDHRASLEPNELKSLVQAIRNIDKVMGDGIKRPSPSEIENKAIVRKSIITSAKIKKGEIFTKKNLAIKRPGTGISPMEWEKIIGQKAKRNFKTDELIEI